VLLRYIVRRVKDFLADSDFDAVQLGAALMAIGCGIVLSLDGSYMIESPRLTVLLDYAPQWIWMSVFCVQGGAQLMAFLLSGRPYFFSRTDNDVIRWLVACIVIELFGVFLWGTLTILLSIHGASWGSVTFGIQFAGCLWASFRLSDKVSRESEYLSLKAIQHRPDVTAEIWRIDDKRRKGAA
jgi:hypothetical protein